MIQVIVRPYDDPLIQAHAEEMIRRYGTGRNINVGWANAERSISSQNDETREILTTRLRRGKITHRVEDYSWDTFTSLK
jgi:hypothetical protein